MAGHTKPRETVQNLAPVREPATNVANNAGIRMTTQFGNVCLMKTTKMASDQTTQLYKFDMKQMKMRPTFFQTCQTCHRFFSRPEINAVAG